MVDEQEELDAFLQEVADLNTHRIEGYLAQGGQWFSVPIVTQVDGNLWQGGCPWPRVPAYFKYVLNLYPWEFYSSAKGTRVKKVEMYDSLDGALAKDQMEALADWVNEKVKLGPTLVHCQAGINRSAFVTGLALIRRGVPADDAIRIMREKRSDRVLSNQAFELWLRNYVP